MLRTVSNAWPATDSSKQASDAVQRTYFSRLRASSLAVGRHEMLPPPLLVVLILLLAAAPAAKGAGITGPWGDEEAQQRQAR